MQTSPVCIYYIDSHAEVINAINKLLNLRYTGFPSVVSFIMQCSSAWQGRFYVKN